MQSTHTTAMALLLLLSAALAAAAEPRTPAAGVALGLASRSSAAVFAPFDAAPGGKPQRLQLAGTQLCVGWSKSDCDGLCLETAPCSDTSPTWTVGPAAKGNATHLRTLTGPCGPAGCCIDFESKVGTLQAFAHLHESVRKPGVSARACFCWRQRGGSRHQGAVPQRRLRVGAQQASRMSTCARWDLLRWRGPAAERWESRDNAG
eukprot:COSAG06_NODE_2316_length_7094_cov_4.313796_3_plen_205_part_00